MATVIGSGLVKLNNGQVIRPEEGGWYDGKQYWGGQLGQVNQIINPNQQGAGGQVSQEVINQTNPNNAAYIEEQKRLEQQRQGSAGGSSGLPGGSAGGNAGLGTGFAAPTNRPTIDLNKLYEQNFNTPEIKAAQGEVDAANAELDAATKARDDAIAAEGDNPFYSQENLTGKTSKITDKYNRDAVRIQNKIAIAANKLATLRSDAQIKTNIATQQYQIDSQNYKDQVSQLNALFAAGGLIGANAYEIADYATAVGVPVGMIQKVVEQQVKDQVKPQVITSTDDSGNVTVSIVDANTGNIIGQNSLGRIDKSKSSGATQADKESYYMELLRQDASRGMVLKDIFSLYTGYLEPNQIIQLYNANSMYGPAKESADELAKYGVKPVNTPFSITNIGQ